MSSRRRLHSCAALAVAASGEEPSWARATSCCTNACLKASTSSRAPRATPSGSCSAVLPRVAKCASRSTGRHSILTLASSSACVSCSTWLCEKRSRITSDRPLSELVMENSNVFLARVVAAEKASCDDSSPSMAQPAELRGSAPSAAALVELAVPPPAASCWQLQGRQRSEYVEFPSDRSPTGRRQRQ